MKRVMSVAVLTLVVMIGCGKKKEEVIAEKIIENATGNKVNVDLENNSMNIETKDGKMSVQTGKSAKIPDTFPSDVFIFEPADVEMAMEMGMGYTIALKTPKDIATVTAAYKKNMVKQGWDQKAAMDMGENTTLMYEKGKRVTNVTVGQEDGETRIALTVVSN